jgi:hypothetical protein
MAPGSPYPGLCPRSSQFHRGSAGDHKPHPTVFKGPPASSGNRPRASSPQPFRALIVKSIPSPKTPAEILPAHLQKICLLRRMMDLCQSTPGPAQDSRPGGNGLRRPHKEDKDSLSARRIFFFYSPKTVPPPSPYKRAKDFRFFPMPKNIR